MRRLEGESDMKCREGNGLLTLAAMPIAPIFAALPEWQRVLAALDPQLSLSVVRFEVSLPSDHAFARLTTSTGVRPNLRLRADARTGLRYRCVGYGYHLVAPAS